MKRLLYILLCLSLTFSVQGQALFFQHNYTAPTGGGGIVVSNADAQDYVDQVEAEAPGVLDQTKADNVSTLCDCITTAIGWSNFLSGGLLHWGSADAIKVNLKNPAGTFATLHGSPALTGTGVQGNATTQWFNTGIPMSVTGQNSAGFGVYVTSAGGANMAYGGSIAPSQGHTRIANDGSTQTSYRINNSSTTLPSGSPANTGLYFATRTASAATVLYRNGSSISTSGTSSATPCTLNTYLLAYNNNGTAASFSNATIAGWFKTSALNATQAANFNTCVEAFFDAEGIGVQ